MLIKGQNNLVIGGFISDDYYFYFEEEAIKQLGKDYEVRGVFICYDNKLPRRLLRMNLMVIIASDQLTSGGTDINFELREACLTITEFDFKTWFIKASKEEKDRGPNLRDGSANVYVRMDGSKNFESGKANLLNLLKQAE